ncbi:MAG TPA: cell division protein FtsZ, partial [Clostridia bacterium]|nr:cell division protein FtsZ [Clostridia bacterium]
SIDGAKGVLLNITGGSNLGLLEVNEAAEIISSAADPEATIIFGAVINDDLKDEVRVTVIATGFDQKQKTPKMGADLNIKQFSSEDIVIPAFMRRHK